MQGELSETHFYTDFVMAGQDAFAQVTFIRIFGRECKLKSVFPRSQYFLCQYPRYILQTLPLSKYVHSMPV